MGQKNKSSRYNEHHLRPRSRGGNNSNENCVKLHKKNVHTPYHDLFTNLRPHEIALLLAFSWKTQYIPNLKNSLSVNSFNRAHHAWNKLFEEKRTPDSVINSLVDVFVKSQEDKDLMNEVYEIYTRPDDGAGTIIQEKAPTEERKEWRMNVDADNIYQCVFGHLDPHEAILVTFFCWATICPYVEFSTTTTHKAERKSMKNRKKNWELLFGKDAKPWDAVRVIESLCDEGYYPQTHALVQEAIGICKAIESH